MGEWWRRPNRGGPWERDKDPFQQAQDNLYSLRRYLTQLPYWPTDRWGPMGYLVIFPDAEFDPRPLPATDPAIIIDGREVQPAERLLERIEESFEWWRTGVHDSNQIGFDVLVHSLAHDLEIRQPLSLQLAEADREIVRLSETQYRVLDGLAASRRVSVSGPAGSGKTLLAAEKARRLAQEGFRVLFTCFSLPLARYLRTAPALADASTLDLFSFQELTAEIAGRAGIAEPPYGSVDADLTGSLTKAVDSIGPLYDAIVVDEGQDFNADWWLPLLTLLEEPDSGFFYVFYDDNQAIYDHPIGLPDGLMPYRLSENWRNAKPIFDRVMDDYRGSAVDPRGPEGPPVETITVVKKDVTSEISRCLHRLVHDEHLEPEDIVVVVEDPSVGVQAGEVGSYRLVASRERPNDIRLRTVNEFKGLESQAVVACGPAAVDDDVRVRRARYIASSRGRALLVRLEVVE